MKSQTGSLAQRIDGVFLLGVYAMPILILGGWLLALLCFYLDGESRHGLISTLAISAYTSVGNFAPFFEIAAAMYLDRTRRKILLMPLNIFGFLVSVMAVTQVTISQVLFSRSGSFIWHKTERAGNRVV